MAGIGRTSQSDFHLFLSEIHTIFQVFGRPTITGLPVNLRQECSDVFSCFILRSLEVSAHIIT